jgi:murein DD-endopeptidase MepM/ murein hydrolase activator NlpD
MAGFVALFRSRQGVRVVALASVAIGLAGCSSDATRFSEGPFSNPYGSRSAPSASREVTGSIPSAPAQAAPVARVETRPLPQYQTGALPPPPPRPNLSSTGSAAGAPGMASYRPAQTTQEVTGSFAPTRPLPQAQAPAQPRQQANANWNWDGGTAITVARGETVGAISRRHGVPVSAILQANGMTAASGIKAGQRLVIPRNGSPAQAPQVAAAPPAAPPVGRPQAKPATVAATTAPATVPAAPSYGGFHVAGPGDTLTKIATRYRVPLVDLAKANNIAPYHQIRMGDRLSIPTRTSANTPASVAPTAPQAAAPAKPAPAVQTAAPARAEPAPQQKVASVEPAHTANLASPAEDPTGGKEAGGAMFRWPVRGRVVTAFGAKPNGQQNDGINIAVPEGTPIKAAEEGEVAYAGNELKGYGNLVLVRHPNGFVTAYAHASELGVKRGDKVKRGQVLGKSGQTGTVTSPQLHFEIRKGSTPVDPSPYLGG